MYGDWGKGMPAEGPEEVVRSQFAGIPVEFGTGW